MATHETQGACSELGTRRGRIELGVDDVFDARQATAATAAGTRVLRERFHTGMPTLDGVAQDAVTHGSAVADDHGAESRVSK